MWDLGDICIYPFWIAWTGPDKSEKKIWDIPLTF